MELNYAVVHDLEKEAGISEASVVLAPTLLSVQNGVVIELVTQIARLIGKRENMAHYGVFRDDPASTRVPDFVKDYCLREEQTPDRFRELTNACMIALQDRAQSQTLATGGYLLFADYTRANNERYFLVAMIKQRSGITMQNLVPTSISELDLSQLHQVARVSFDRLSQYEAALDPQDLTYVTFVSPPRNQKVAGYFITALGCEKGTTATASTKAVIVGTHAFFGDRESIRSEGNEARVALVDLLRTKADNKQRVSLSEVVEVVRRRFPPHEAEDLADDFVAHLQSESYRVPAEFPVSAEVVKRYTRFTYRSSQLKVEIDKDAVTTDDSGPIYFDDRNSRLVISEDDLIAALRESLREDG